MGRGRMGGNSSSSRGSRGFSGSSSVGSSFHRHRGFHSHHTTVFVGGSGHSVHHRGGSPVIGIVVGAIFVLVGIFIIFGGFAQMFRYSTVDATAVLNEKSYGYYYTTYDYTIDGEKYTNRSMQSWEFPEEINKVVTIYYLKSDPNKIYEECPTNKTEAGIMVFAGFICAGIGALPLALCIRELKKGKSNSRASNTDRIENEEMSNKCPYCGAKYNKASTTCPKCGASRLD